MRDHTVLSSLQLLQRQRSHVLFVLSAPQLSLESEFLNWYQGAYRAEISAMSGVLEVRHYEQHEIDITGGQYPRLPFQYLGVIELSLDGAQASQPLIERITSLHRQQVSAATPATWLYYPAGEKVGQLISDQRALLTLAFANGLCGREDEFREWYATRHIRHALNIPALVSGQIFLRTQFQQPGAMAAKFTIIAMYEQVGPPESILQSFASLPEDTLRFPSMDMSRFAEWVYRLL